MDLEFTINNQICERTDTNKIVNLSANYLTLNFDFETEDWTGLTKFVIFNNKTRVAVNDNAVTVPSSTLTGDSFTFTIYGVEINDDDEITIRITTNLNVIHLLDSGYTDETTDDADIVENDTITAIYLAIDEKANSSDVYTQSEVDTLLNAVYDAIGNRIVLEATSDIIETDDTVTFNAYLIKNGIPRSNQTINFYNIEEE